MRRQKWPAPSAHQRKTPPSSPHHGSRGLIVELNFGGTALHVCFPLAFRCALLQPSLPRLGTRVTETCTPRSPTVCRQGKRKQQLRELIRTITSVEVSADQALET